MTNMSLERERSVTMSSVTPSAKRSHLGSFPMFSNGKTAMEAFSDSGVDKVHHHQAVKPANSASKTAIVETDRTLKCVLREKGCEATGPCERPRRRSRDVAFGLSGRGPGVAG